MLSEKTLISISNYIFDKERFIKSFLFRILILITSYKITFKSKAKTSSLIMLINHEFEINSRHLNEFLYLSKYLKKNDCCHTFVHIRRVFDIFSLKYLFYDKTKILESQFYKVYSKINTHNKLLVHCDSVPLQNFFVENYNKLKKRTFSLQHGFYGENKVFDKVYESSNSSNFFIWDQFTLNKYLKYSNTRNYIESGPFYFQKISSNKKVSDKNHYSFYSAGFDRHLENKYIIRCCRYLNSKGIKTTIISHPKINFFQRLYLSFKYKYFFSSNSLKSRNFNLNLTINSTVINELFNSGRKVMPLDNFFSLNKIPKYFKPVNNLNLPVYNCPNKSLKIILKNLKNVL